MSLDPSLRVDAKGSDLGIAGRRGVHGSRQQNTDRLRHALGYDGIQPVSPVLSGETCDLRSWCDGERGPPEHLRDLDCGRGGCQFTQCLPAVSVRPPPPPHPQPHPCQSDGGDCECIVPAHRRRPPSNRRRLDNVVKTIEAGGGVLHNDADRWPNRARTCSGTLRAVETGRTGTRSARKISRH